MKWIFLRVFLLVLYIAAAFFVFLAFAGAGEGTTAPVAVFCPWALIMMMLLGIEDGWAPAAGYLIVMFVWITRAGLSSRHWALVWPLSVHALGVLLALSVMEPGDFGRTDELALSLAVSVALSTGYYAFDALLANITRLALSEVA